MKCAPLANALVIAACLLGGAGLIWIATGHDVLGPIATGSAGLIAWAACEIPLPQPPEA